MVQSSRCHVGHISFSPESYFLSDKCPEGRLSATRARTVRPVPSSVPDHIQCFSPVPLNMAKTASSESFIYHDGFQMNITSHNPPPPFGHRYYSLNDPSEYPPDPTPTHTKTDYVFRYHPIETEAVRHPLQTIMTIVKQLTDRHSNGARVFICKLNPRIAGQKDELVFAKIYDPLYYSYAFMGIESVLNPVVNSADVDYSREAAAYDHMCRTKHDGRLAPSYYGSWTFTTAPYQGKTRPVRLILTEYVAGPSLYQQYYQSCVPDTFPRQTIPPNERPDLPDGFRLRILASALKLKAQQLRIGLDQNDFAPRNIIVLLTGQKEDGLEKRTIQRMVVVDYNQSFVYPRTNRKFVQKKRPQNPMEAYWNRSVPDFDEWVPKTWHSNPDLRREWLYSTFGQSERYEPLREQIQAEVTHFLKSPGRKPA